jgi:hypothetical protein
MRLGEWLRENVLGDGPSGDFAVSHHDYRSSLRERVREALRARGSQGKVSEADIERMTEKAIDMTESRDLSSLPPDIPGPPPQSWYDVPLDTVTGIITGVLVEVLKNVTLSGTEQGQQKDENQVIQEAIDSTLAEHRAATLSQHIRDGRGE